MSARLDRTYPTEPRFRVLLGRVVKALVRDGRQVAEASIEPLLIVHVIDETAKLGLGVGEGVVLVVRDLRTLACLEAALGLGVVVAIALGRQADVVLGLVAGALVAGVLVSSDAVYWNFMTTRTFPLVRPAGVVVHAAGPCGQPTRAQERTLVPDAYDGAAAAAGALPARSVVTAARSAAVGIGLGRNAFAPTA